MQRHVLLLDLRDDAALIAEYRRWHAPGGPPAVVIEAIRASGVEAMEIHLSGDRLVMVIEARDDFDFAAKGAADAADPQIQAWETLMSRFQKPVPWAGEGEKWVRAERIFSLAEQG